MLSFSLLFIVYQRCLISDKQKRWIRDNLAIMRSRMSRMALQYVRRCVQGSTKACSSGQLADARPLHCHINGNSKKTLFALQNTVRERRNLQTSNRTTVWEACDIKYRKGKPWDYEKELSTFSAERVLLRGLFKNH